VGSEALIQTRGGSGSRRSAGHRNSTFGCLLRRRLHGADGSLIRVDAHSRLRQLEAPSCLGILVLREQLSAVSLPGVSALFAGLILLMLLPRGSKKTRGKPSGNARPRVMGIPAAGEREASRLPFPVCLLE